MKNIVYISSSFILNNFHALQKQHSIWKCISINKPYPYMVYFLCDINYNKKQIKYINPDGCIQIFKNGNTITCKHMILSDSSLCESFWTKICIQLLYQFGDRYTFCIPTPPTNSTAINTLTQNFSFKMNGNKLIKYPNQITRNIEDYRQYIYSEQNSCHAKAEFSTTSILFLQNILYNYHIDKKGQIQQNEMAGLLTLSYSKSFHNYIIDIDFSHIVNGNGDDVDYPNGFFNYHIHPVNAYIIHNTRKGWPSNSDYIVFLQNYIQPPEPNMPKTYFTCVSALEGMYIITFTKKTIEDIENSTTSSINLIKEYTSRIKKQYNISKRDSSFKTTDLHFTNKPMFTSYVNTINSISNPIFKLFFCEWNSLSKFTFSFNFPKTNGECVLK